MRLSYSGYNTYHNCPYSYYIQYIEELVPNEVGSALIFGSMIDEALNDVLEGKEVRPFDYGDKPIVWSKIDYAPLLLNKVEMKKIDKFARNSEWKGHDVHEAIMQIFLKAGRLSARWNTLSEHQKAVIDYACKISSEKKKDVIVKKYIKDFMPQLNKVISVQEKLTFGNFGRGIADFVAEHEGKTVIFDNKTSKRLYPENSVATSMQLALYGAELGLNWAGYVVMRKDFTSRSAKAQLIVDKIPEKMKELSLEALETTHKAIEKGSFPKNLSKCDSMYGKRCPFYDYCHKGDKSNLVKKEKR